MTAIDLVPWVISGAAALLITLDRVLAGRRSEWRQVAEAKQQRIDDLEERVRVLEGQISVLTSDFAGVIAAKVVECMKVDCMKEET